MPFETCFLPANFDGTITATVHEHGIAEPPTTIIKTDQPWSVHIRWENTGFATGMIAGHYHLHCMLERMGPGPDLDLIDFDPGDHLTPLTPGPSPVSYDCHFDVPAGTVTVPSAGGLFKLVVSLTYREPVAAGIGPPGPIAAYVEGPMIQFYNP